MIENTIVNTLEPKIQGLICIDCWEDETLRDYYKNLEKQINFSEIESICVANYELALDSKDLSQRNLLETYSWIELDPQMLLPVMKESRFQSTSQWLQSKFSMHSFLLLDMYSLSKHINNSVSHIKNWLIIGGAWKYCIHSRPINLHTIKSLPYNFFITPWSIYNIDKKSIDEQDIMQDDLRYMRYQNNFFKIL